MFALILPLLPFMSKIGAYMGIIGGIFNCLTNTKYKLVGFTIWFVSNTILVIWAYNCNEIELMYMYIFFFATSGIGIYTHWKLLKKMGIKHDN
jgi:hypothetical protein